MDEVKKQEMWENIEKEIREGKAEIVSAGSQVRSRRKTLRPAHLCKTDRRKANRIARASRKANR